ncbi:putative transcription factor WRKY family [Medicago truncatula]|uniref:Putative transcription factor WRKY family n=1 Tax=Medicago truncatula TaxID=3880 RepID=A0A072TYN7_MEDTR|nr:probable WRKY transcription factor 75 [Medicago truncatula]KEH21958.1 WRKY family transcription factor [Medicago truncatula]KEH21975.1 WRKY family transcription factor [Medicago truncatula]RHN44937.1 putative transcription factor WRKY family [Medicago truncatula]
MENNYSMLFPCPPSSSYQIPTSGLNGQSSNAFLGLKPTNNEISVTHDDHEDVKGEEGSVNVIIDQQDVKKKGEKKAKKPKYAFQTRSQVDILDDGYRWRKYGQKAVKNNKFPRSYYRCTHQGCNVKKQVQRLTKDEGVVVTTYEGVHTHPIEKTTDNFEHILSQMQIYTPF